eukprot:CAMPEP_0182424908 /NCGR_PEP_ID=MMETSP1167-20130531/11177_1 /TAXON_ID=2988 /ORGANISM="Mallomonas Sp, Strain CCMP3275" /LENGTH=576 /DNA_ID=CAMNT_0024605079 /DNA_START=80 /DNA_END=1807 /DNA_ORIENTATION=-
MANSAAYQMMISNIDKMQAQSGFDVVIVCCSSAQQARYWQKRLEGGRGTVLPSSSIVLSVQEDWPGGAGNALGTLFAYVNAVALASERYGMDINSKLQAGEISVGLYHTAGKGTRLAPLPGAENNNKPGVKLPATIKVNGVLVPMTILEAVIRQTGCYAKSRPGRLSVFWGDQVFIPTVPVEYKVTHHVDILCSLGPMPTEAEWTAKGMHNYGLIAVNSGNRAAQVEKVDHSTAVKLLKNLGELKSVGASLGSFSVSAKMLFFLLEEFKNELMNRKGKFDSDPHLWMPMTLDKPAYTQLMGQKGITAEKAGVHHDRIQSMMSRFHADSSTTSLDVFGPVDVGQGFYWWDFGQLLLYQRNTLMVTESTPESDLMRMFFGISSHRVRDSAVIKTTIDGASCVSSCHIGNSTKENNGTIKDSVLSNVRCNYIEAEGCIMVNVTADSIIARPGSIIYNIVDDTDFGLELSEGQVLAGVFNDEGSQIIMRSSTKIDGGKAWEEKLEWNPKTFQDVYNMNTEADPLHLEKKISSAHSRLWRSLSVQPSFFHQVSTPRSEKNESFGAFPDLLEFEKKMTASYW